MEIKHAIAFVVASLSASAVHSASIKSYGNSEFIVTPQDTPSYIASSHTPGSPNFVPHKEITSVDAGALYAIFNGLFERKYYFSKGMKDEWDVDAYGPKWKIGFWFDGGSRFTDRNEQYTKGIIGYARMGEWNAMAHWSSFYQYRPSWACGLFSVGSRRVKLNDGKYLNREEMPNFEWTGFVTDTTRTPSGVTELGDLVREKMLVVENLSKTASSDSGNYGFLVQSMQLLGENPYIHFSTQHDSVYNTTMTDAISNYFGKSSWESSGAYEKRSRLLQKDQPWMSSAGPWLAMFDRCYTASRVYPESHYKQADTNELHLCGGVRNSTAVKTSGHITRNSDNTITFDPPISVSMSDWNVGQANYYDYYTPVDTKKERAYQVSGKCFPVRKMITPPNQVIGKQIDVDEFMTHCKSILSRGTNTVVVSFWPWYESSSGSDQIDFDIRHIPGSGEPEYAHMIAETESAFDDVPITFLLSVSKSYSYDCYCYTSAVIKVENNFRPKTNHMTDGRYTALTGYFTYEGTNDIFSGSEQSWYGEGINVRYRASSGVGYGDALKMVVNSALSDSSAEMTDDMIETYGDFTDPETYATITADECKATIQEVTDGNFRVLVSNEFFEIVYDGVDSISDMTLLDMEDPTFRMPIRQGVLPNDFVMTDWWQCVSPNIDTVEYTDSSTTNKDFTGQQNMVIIQRQDFSFSSLRPSDSDELVQGPADGDNLIAP